MTLMEFFAFGALVLSIGGIIYNAGRNAANAAQSKAYADGLGKNLRDLKDKVERRWKHDLATHLDQVDDPIAKAVAAQLRQDAWRD